MDTDNYNVELPFIPQYSSVHGVTNANATSLYRPYENMNSINNDDWHNYCNINTNPMLANAPNVAANAYPEQTLPWPHLVPEYQNYPQFANVNCLWSQFYFQLQHTALDARGSFNFRQTNNGCDESSISSQNQENEFSRNIPTTSNHYNPAPFALPLTRATDSAGITFSNQLNQNSNGPLQTHQLPVRHFSQQANSELVFQCHDCFRFCSSAGGLKRHAKFCRASKPNLQNIFSSLKQPASSLSDAPHQSVLTDINEGAAKQTENALCPSLSTLLGKNQSPALKSPTLVITLSDSPSPHSPSRPPSNESSSCVPSHTPSLPDPQIVSTPASAPSPLTESPDSFAAGETSHQKEISRVESNERAPNLTNVLNARSNRKQWQCPHCPKTFPSERTLIDHLASHNIGKPYTCSTCGSHFTRKFHLARHVRQKGCDGNPRIQHPCEYCGKPFSRKDNLREHIKGHMGQSRPRPKIPCPMPDCKKEFVSRVQLQTHLNHHNNERPYTCQYDSCGKSFRSRGSLRKHQRVHFVSKPYQCSQCSASFEVLETLTQHVATHITEGSFTCEQCPSKFSQESELKEHVAQRHQNDDEYSCSLCRRKYRRRWRLQQHYRLVHCERRTLEGSLGSAGDQQTDEQTGKDPDQSLLMQTQTFSCNICQKEFASRQSLKVHYLTHPVEAPVSCPECKKSFVRRECLLRHLHTRHRMPTILAIQAIQDAQGVNVQSAGTATVPHHEACLNNDVLSSGTPQSFGLPPQLPDVPANTSALEANILELLNLLVDSSSLRNFGWPEKSVDSVLQAILAKCGRQPATDDSEPVVQRLRTNVKHLFSFIVDDHAALESLFARRPIEQVLEQVIQLAKSNDSNNNIVQLPL